VPCQYAARTARGEESSQGVDSTMDSVNEDSITNSLIILARELQKLRIAMERIADEMVELREKFDE
jgi:hypothetical protein